MKRSILFEELFRNHIDYIAGALRRVNCNEGEIEDIIHNAYIRASDKVHQLKDEKSFVPWFTAIAINESYRYRKKNSEYVLLGTPEELNRIISENEWSGFYLEDSVTTRLSIEEAMEKIPEEYLVPFKLSVFENYKYREIAIILSIKEGTVKSRINRARVLLRELLKEEEGEHTTKQTAK